MPQPKTVSDLLEFGLLGRPALITALDPELLAADPPPDVPAGTAFVSAFKHELTKLEPGQLGILVDEVSVASTPQAIANVMITEKYRQLGGAGGLLGNTTTAVSPCPDGNGYYRHFQHGSIYWHPHTGAHEVHGLIRGRWAEMGWERSFLGYPTTDELVGRDPTGAGRVSHFQAGSLYWHPESSSRTHTTDASLARAAVAAGLADAAKRRLDPVETDLTLSHKASVLATVNPPNSETSGPITMMNPIHAGLAETVRVKAGDGRRQVFEVHGVIRARYLALGGEASILGYPTTDETAAPDGTGRYNHFQAGSIYWTPRTGAHEVHGLIRDMWAAAGWERDPTLGYPLTDELVPDRRVGSRRPDSRRKPVLGLPADVVKLPATAIEGRFPETVLNLPEPHPAVGSLPKPEMLEGAHTTLAGQELKLGTAVEFGASGQNVAKSGALSGIMSEVVAGPVTSPAAERSNNRFADFQNGVAFWHRGETAAKRLAPWRKDGGTGPTLPVADVVAAATNQLKAALTAQSPGLAGLTFAGVTDYTHDGAGVHNRRHRLTARLGKGQTFEVEAVVAFDPIARLVTLSFPSWRQILGIGLSPDVVRALHQRLDPLLWRATTLLDVSVPRDADPVAVLSVKTLVTGDVAIYLEPPNPSIPSGVDVIPGGVADPNVRQPLKNAITPFAKNPIR